MSSSDVDAILALIEKRSQAAVNEDFETLDSVLGEGFRYINKWGDLIERKAYFADKKSKASSSNSWIAQTIDETDVELIGTDVALVTFRVLDHQRDEGRELKELVRTSYLCRRIHGAWQLTFGQTSPVVADD